MYNEKINISLFQNELCAKFMNFAFHKHGPTSQP